MLVATQRGPTKGMPSLGVSSLDLGPHRQAVAALFSYSLRYPSTIAAEPPRAPPCAPKREEIECALIDAFVRGLSKPIPRPACPGPTGSARPPPKGALRTLLPARARRFADTLSTSSLPVACAQTRAETPKTATKMSRAHALCTQREWFSSPALVRDQSKSYLGKALTRGVSSLDLGRRHLPCGPSLCLLSPPYPIQF